MKTTSILVMRLQMRGLRMIVSMSMGLIPFIVLQRLMQVAIGGPVHFATTVHAVLSSSIAVCIICTAWWQAHSFLTEKPIILQKMLSVAAYKAERRELGQRIVDFSFSAAGGFVRWLAS